MLPNTSSVFPFLVFQIRKGVGGVFGRFLGGAAAIRGFVAAPSMVVAIDLFPFAFTGFRCLGVLGRKQVSFDFFETTGEAIFHGWA